MEGTDGGPGGSWRKKLWEKQFQFGQSKLALLSTFLLPSGDSIQISQQRWYSG